MSDDLFLLERLKSKDPAAMDKLADIYGGKIYNLAMGMLKNQEDAEDVLQDTLLQVYMKIDTFRSESALSSWIYKIALNFSYMKIRKNKKDNSISLDESMPQFKPDGMHLNIVANWSEKGDSAYLTKELGIILKDNIAKLSEKYRTVLVLRDVEGLSTEEVADITGMTVPAVKSRLHRARLFLREKLSEYYNE